MYVSRESETRYLGTGTVFEQSSGGLATVLGICGYGTTLYPKNAAKDNSVKDAVYVVELRIVNAKSY